MAWRATLRRGRQLGVNGNADATERVPPPAPTCGYLSLIENCFPDIQNRMDNSVQHDTVDRSGTPDSRPPLKQEGGCGGRFFPGIEWVAVPAVLLMLLLIVTYGNSFHAPFQFDDFVNITDNPNVQPRNFSVEEFAAAIHGRDPERSKISRPLAYLTLAANYFLEGQDPFGYHVFNFAVHGLCTLLLFFFTYRILRLTSFGRARDRNSVLSVALLSAALWASHPIQVTAVTYIVQRMAALAALFTLLSMFSYVELRTAQRLRHKACYAAACVLFGGLAVASKENAAMLPVNLALVEVLILGGGISESRRPKAWMIIGAAVFLVLLAALWFTDIGKILNGYGNRPFTLWQRLMTEPRVFLLYVSLLLYPVSHRFMMLHDVRLSTGLFAPWTTFPAILAAAAFPVAAWLLRRRWPLLAFSMLFFWVNHLIEGTVVPLEIVFEHRNYLPSMFFFLPAAMGFCYLVERYSMAHLLSLAAFALLAVFLAAQGHTAYMRNAVFAHPILLWQDNVAKAPGLHRPRHNLGNAYLAYGSPEKGVRELQSSLMARAAGRKDQKFKTYYNLGLFSLSRKSPVVAEKAFRKALKMVPGNGKALFGLAGAKILEGDFKKAEAYAVASLRANPGNPEALVALSWIRLRQGKISSAKALAVSAVRMAPESRLPFFALGEALRMEGKRREALACYELYRRDFADDPNVLVAMIETEAGLGDEARLKKSVDELCRKSGDRLSEVLRQYDAVYNCLGAPRMERVRKAIVDVVSDRLKELAVRK